MRSAGRLRGRRVGHRTAEPARRRAREPYVTTTSAIPARRGDLGTCDVLLLGAAGNSGALIGAELAARGLSVRLAGRRAAPLDDLAQALSAGGATARPGPAAAEGRGSLPGGRAGASLVLNTVGPSPRRAGPVLAACLAARVPYVDIANEFPAVW